MVGTLLSINSFLQATEKPSFLIFSKKNDNIDSTFVLKKRKRGRRHQRDSHHRGFRGRTGPQGAQGVQGPQGPQGPQGAQGARYPSSWIQLYDKTFTNECTENGYLNLSNEGIDPNYTTGGYRLETKTVTNDTLVFPEPGHYLVLIHFDASFFQTTTNPSPGASYQIFFSVLDQRTNQPLTDINYVGLLPLDTVSLCSATLTSNLMVYNPNEAPKIGIFLHHFPFNYASENRLNIENLKIHVQKLD